MKTFIQRLGQAIHQRPRLEKALDRLLRPFEHASKIPVFGCKMCGQCILHSTGLTCPMTCPKNLRNGPCGGVRMDGACEVIPEKRCTWVKAYHRSQQLLWPEEIHDLQPHVDWSLKNSSSWINLITGRDQISFGCNSEPTSTFVEEKARE